MHDFSHEKKQIGLVLITARVVSKTYFTEVFRKCHRILPSTLPPIL